MGPKRILLVFVAAVLPLVMSAQQSKTDETVEFRPHSLKPENIIELSG